MEYSFSPDAESSDAWTFRNPEEAQATESAFSMAISMVESGQSIQQVLDGIDLPEHLKRKLMARLQEIVRAKQQREHEMAQQTRAKAAEKSVGLGKIFSMSMIASVISREAMEKLQRVFAPNTALGNEVKQQGQKLLKNGAEPDLEFARSQQQTVSGPGVGMAQTQQQQRQK